jgi:hypothetical protein
LQHLAERRALAPLTRQTNENREQVEVLPTGLVDEVGRPADKIPDRHEELDQEPGRIGLTVWLYGSHDFTGESAKRQLPKWVGPLGRRNRHGLPAGAQGCWFY